MSNKKTVERSILDFLYLEKDFKIENFERPDFILTTPSNLKFGVEVTEFFIRESNARLKKMDSYLDELIDSKKYRHKNDYQELKVDEIKIIKTNNKEEIRTTAIIQQPPSYEDFINRFNSTLKNKNERFEKYDNNLNHINLIISDESNYLSSIKLEEYFTIIFKPNVIESIKNSKFKEIFFVLRIDNHKVALPLRTILLTAEAYLFHKVLISSNKVLKDEIQYHEWFVEYLHYVGHNSAFLTKTNKVHVIYGNVGLLVENIETKPSISILKFDDFELPNKYQSNRKTEKFINSRTKKLIESITSTFRFQTGIYYEINSKKSH